MAFRVLCAFITVLGLQSLGVALADGAQAKARDAKETKGHSKAPKRKLVGLADGFHDVEFHWAQPTEFAQPLGRGLSGHAGDSNNFVDPRSGQHFRLDHQMRQKHQSKVVFLDVVAGVNGTAFVSTDSSDVLIVAFNSTMFAREFVASLKESVAASEQVFLTSTRQGASSKVFLAEIVTSSVTLGEAEGTSIVHLEYSEASYEDIFQDATIRLHAALTPPTPEVAPSDLTPSGPSKGHANGDGDHPDHRSRRGSEGQALTEASPRRLWFVSSFLKVAWRAAKNVARVAATAVAVVAENLGLTDFGGDKTVTLATFDASSTLQSYLPGSTCTATSTLRANVSFHLKIASATLDFATLQVTGTLANLLQITGQRSFEASQEWKVVSLPRWNFQILIGAVPVILDVGAHLFAGYEFSVSGAHKHVPCDHMAFWGDISLKKQVTTLAVFGVGCPHPLLLKFGTGRYTFRAVADAVMTVGATYRDGQARPNARPIWIHLVHGLTTSKSWYES